MYWLFHYKQIKVLQVYSIFMWLSRDSYYHAQHGQETNKQEHHKSLRTKPAPVTRL